MREPLSTAGFSNVVSSCLCVFNPETWCQDAGFLHHLQQRGDSVVVFSGCRGQRVFHGAGQRVDPLGDPPGEWPVRLFPSEVLILVYLVSES